eukprot:tig00020961_g16759.t1
MASQSRWPAADDVDEVIKMAAEEADSAAAASSAFNGRSSPKDVENVAAALQAKIAELEDDAPEPGDAAKDKKKSKDSKDAGGDAYKQKYLAQVQETKKAQQESATLRKKIEQSAREKDTIYAELTKSNAIKSKLETLCRELQKNNKIILEESKRVALDEATKRQELSKKFHDTIKDITQKLEEQGEERMKQFRENELLRDKLKNFAEQYELREQHFAHQLKTKDLEQQLWQAKFQQQKELADQEAVKAAAYKEQAATLVKTEQELRSQLQMYGEKFEQFQETLTKSNEVFNTFKKEMEKMSKTIKQLEKENTSLKDKCQKSDITIIEMIEEKTSSQKKFETLKAQKEKLEGLCRTLQERQKKQAAENSSPPPAPAAPA